MSKNHHLVYKSIIWYRKLSFGINICSYLTLLLLFDRVFSELFGRNFNPYFFRYRSWFEVFIYLHIGDGGGWWAPFESEGK